MSFQISIKNNIDSADNHFGASEVRTFDQPLVTVGSDPSCDCMIDEQGGAQPRHLSIVRSADGRNWTVVPEIGVELFVNAVKIHTATPLRSGDEIRLGHWTLKLRNVYGAAKQARRADLTARFSQILLGLILLAEIGIVAWLPRQMKHASRWEAEIARQRAALLLDQLRREAETETGEPLARDAMKTVLDQLNKLAGFIRANEESLARSQWRQIEADLGKYTEIIERLKSGAAFAPMPELQVNSVIESILDLEKESHD